MPRHFEKKIVPYTQQQMFELVADVKSYPEFLPWCHAVRVYEKNGNVMKADMTVGHGHVSDSFTSIVTLSEADNISVRYGGGALKHLINEWDFKKAEDSQSCEVQFLVDFKLRSVFLSAMMELFFHKAFHKMVEAFEERAKDLYGKK